MKEQNYKYEITEHVGTISTSPKGWTLELNVIDWDKGGRYDLRRWSPGHVQYNKGVRFSESDLETLYKLLKEKVETK